MKRRLAGILIVASVLIVGLAAASSLRAQGREYGENVGEAGRGYGERIKKGFSPDDGKERAPAQKAGHAAKEFGKGTGEFFKEFGKSTGRFFKGIFTKH